MNQSEPSNTSIPLHLFKLKGDSYTYIIGSIALRYVDSIRISNPVFIHNYPLAELVACNTSPESNLEFSILIDDNDILYTLQQDFIPKEVVEMYRHFWKTKKNNLG